MTELFIDGPNLVTSLTSGCGNSKIVPSKILNFFRSSHRIDVPRFYNSEFTNNARFNKLWADAGFQVTTIWGTDIDSLLIEQLHKPQKGKRLILVSGDGGYYDHLAKRLELGQKITVASTRDAISVKYADPRLEKIFLEDFRSDLVKKRNRNNRAF